MVLPSSQRSGSRGSARRSSAPPASTEFLVRVLGGLVGGAAIVAWWLFFSRAPWSERLGVVGLLIASLASTWLAGDKSIQVWILWYSAPLLGLALVGALVATRGQDPRTRRAATAAAILLTCAATTLVKIVGVTGNGVAHFTWRWTDTPEDRLLARPDDEPQPAPAAGKSSCVGGGSGRTQAGHRPAVAGGHARHVETGQTGRSRAVRELARLPRSRLHRSHPRPAHRHRLVVGSAD